MILKKDYYIGGSLWLWNNKIKIEEPMAFLLPYNESNES